MYDPYNVWDGKKFQFTLDKILKIVFGEDDYSISEKFEKIRHDKVKRIAADNLPAVKGLRVLFDLSWNKTDEESRPKVIEHLKNGVVVFSNREFTDENGNLLETIYVEEPWEAWIKIGQYAKAVFPMPTIGITGSTGKTTSTMFAQCVFNERYKTFISGEDGKNYNTPLTVVGQWLLRCNPEFTFHMQECGGETPDLIKTTARIINCDAFAINNIDTRQHLATYGSPECLIADKTSFDRVRKDTTVGVINLDDEILRDFRFESPLITFGIKNKSADYVAENICQNGPMLEFDIVGKGEVVPIKIRINGKYNVYNALLVFALAKHFELTNEEIQRGFLNYRSIGIRQNLREVAGRLVYMDCYNASPESTVLAVQTLAELKPGKRGRRIAFVGERKAATDEIYEINYAMGQELAKIRGIDEFIIVGEDPVMAVHLEEVEAKTEEDKRRAHGTYDGLLAATDGMCKISYSTNLKELAEKVKYHTQRGDVLLFKGRYQLALWSIVDMALGTGYTKSQILAPLGLKKKYIKTKSNVGEYSAYFGGIDLTSSVNGFDNTQYILPNVLEGYPVVRTADKMMKNHSQLRRIVFGSNIRSIGDESFYRCTNLEELQLPAKCIYIGDRSFYGCKSLVRVTALGVQHISMEAFRGCEKLKSVYLSEACMTIEENAFAECPNVLICAPEHSWAAQYAQNNGLSFRAIDAAEEKTKLSPNGTRREPNVYSVPLPKPTFVPVPYEADKTRTHLNVVFTGDIMAHDSHLKQAFDSTTGEYCFDKFFEYTAKYLKNADIAVGNVETTFGLGAYTGFPKFNTPEQLAEAMQRAGFDVAAVANNHMYDSGFAGLQRTGKILKLNGMAVVGSKQTPEEPAYVIVERKGIKVAILNYTYLTPSVGGRKTVNRQLLDENAAALINSFSYETLDADLEAIRNDITNAKAQADVVLMFYHWGSEYETRANIIQKYIAVQTAKMGVDAIIGSHSHVIQEESSVTVEIDGELKTVPIFYGLGNYSWGSRLSRTCRETVQNGMLAMLDILYNKDSGSVESIKTDHKPLHIRSDYIGGQYDCSILSLTDMNGYERQAFSERSSKSVDELIAEVEASLHPADYVPTEQKFDAPMVLKIGEFKNIRQHLPNIEFQRIVSQNASIAAVLQNGDVVGYKPGFTGIALMSQDGTVTETVVQVIDETVAQLPMLVNDNNRLPDIYLPKKLCSGTDYALGAASLEERAANDWKKLYLFAKEYNIFFRVVRGYETRERQIRTLCKRCEVQEVIPDLEEAQLGYSFHNLGTALDIAIDEKTLNNNDYVVQWLKRQAWRFGWVVCKYDENEVIHMNYVMDTDEANILRSLSGDIEQYLTDYDMWSERVSQRRVWKNEFISNEEKAKSKNEWDVLTLRRICDIIGVDVPIVYRGIEDRVVPNIALSSVYTVPGTVYFYDKGQPKSLIQCRNALRDSATPVITNRVINDEIGNMAQQITVDDSFVACGKVCKYILDRNKVNVIAVNEASNDALCGKILQHLLAARYNVSASLDVLKGSANTVNAIQSLKQADDFYVQTLSPMFAGAVARSLELFAPKIAVAVGRNEQAAAKFADAADYEKEVCDLLDATLNNGGIAFVNIDEPILRKYDGRENVKTLSLKSANADYYMSVSGGSGNNTATLSIHCREEKEIVTLWAAKKWGENLISVLAAYAVAVNSGMREKELLKVPVSKTSFWELSDSQLAEVQDSMILHADETSVSMEWPNTLQATGYHIRCYNSSDEFVSGTHIYVGSKTGNGATYKIDRLQPNSQYKIRIRGYLIKNGVKYYGEFTDKHISTKARSK